MPAVASHAHVFAQHGQRRAAGLPTPTVLVGAEAFEAWLTALPTSAGSVRTAAASPEEAAHAYLADSAIRRALEARVLARVEASRGAAPAGLEKTPFEHAVWLEVSRDILLTAGDLDGQLLLQYLHSRASRENGAMPPLRALAAAHRILGGEARPLLLLEPHADGLDASLRVAVALVEAVPALHLAIATSAEAWATWQRLPDREHAKAVLRPCVVELSSPVPSALADARRLAEKARASGTREDDDLARSAAERALYEGLEAAPRSRGLFALNHCLDVDFGPRKLEIDLACTSLRLAVEVDGYFHFMSSDAYRRDRRKDILLQKEGYFVLRVLAEDVVSRLAEILESIHDAMSFLFGVRAKENRP